MSLLYIRNKDTGEFEPVKALRGEQGTTFTPSVSEDGTLSWTNDGGLANPDPVKIEGKDGEPGKTPVRGTDYWTEEDKQVILEELTESKIDPLSEQKVDKTNVVNNFTTTEEGFVADARALKTLNDGKTSASILANGEQSMGSYAMVTIRSTGGNTKLRAVLLLPDSVYALVVAADGTTFATKIGGSDIPSVTDVIGEMTLTIAKWTRFKLIVISGTYELIYSN